MNTFDPHRYTITIKLVSLDEGEHFEAIVAELPDLVEYGETYDQAYSLAVESIQALREAASEQGREFPVPLPSQALTEYSGRITLRMSKSIHASVSKLADREGVSLNSWIVEAISERVGASVSATATANTYSWETVRAFNIVFSHAGAALTAARGLYTADVIAGNQVIEFKGGAAHKLSTAEAGVTGKLMLPH